MDDGAVMLEALRARGGFAREGGLASRFTLELQGEGLRIGILGECYIDRGWAIQDESHYYLEPAAAARLLSALREDFGTAEPPERFLPLEFEFKKPDRPLYQYLEARRIPYVYEGDRRTP